ncbi:murein L,D-transpeptidase family protein [Aureispira sp. CCB-QB1]|uniref:L,D-transpeptidase family protein n=1 Tax=Aureispira sp. CCB-QB1 TaxID=1313421 RepID=UPI0009DD4066|nr:L,D-transpeptidase family protein [Aureispira sp. CCB-QB1]
MNPILLLFSFILLTTACNNPSSPRPQTVSSSPLLLLQKQQIDSTNFELFLRAFKKEQIVEVWAKEKLGQQFKKIQTYSFCTSSGLLGPKRQEGDRQIPEGCYWIDRFNPNSKFHLSLGLNYPNDSDRKLGHAQYPGGDIFIHGGCASIGCIPITNRKIEELYALTSEAQRLGQTKIQVHIFPSNKMKSLINNATQHMVFWQNLYPIFDYFETKHTLPKVWIKPNGTYAIAN